MELFLPILFIILFFYFKNSSAEPERIAKFMQDINVIGHRGSPKMQPENTMLSIEHARNEGVDAVEFDVALTKDCIPILLHDDTLDRTTNCDGRVCEYSLNDLNRCDFGAKFRYKHGPGSVEFIGVTTIEDAVKWALKHRVKMFFDVKSTNPKMVNVLNWLFHTYDLYDLVVVSSLYPKVIYSLKRLNPKILISFAWCRWPYSYHDLYGKLPCYPDSVVKQKAAEVFDKINMWCAMTWLPYFLGAEIILVERAFTSEAYVRYYEASGRCVIAWSVNDAIESRWMNKVLRIPIISDQPGRVISAIRGTVAEVFTAVTEITAKE